MALTAGTALVEPVWVAMWDGNGKLLLLAARDLPRHAHAANLVLQMLRAFGGAAGRDPGQGLPVLAALTSPN